MRWLSSGLRRDVCVVLYALDGSTGQEAKATLEDHYDRRLSPDRFYGALEALVDAGHATERADGVHDRYALTGVVRTALYIYTTVGERPTDSENVDSAVPTA